MRTAPARKDINMNKSWFVRWVRLHSEPLNLCMQHYPQLNIIFDEYIKLKVEISISMDSIMLSFLIGVMLVCTRTCTAEYLNISIGLLYVF
jgi:hypothetical protein